MSDTVAKSTAFTLLGDFIMTYQSDILPGLELAEHDGGFTLSFKQRLLLQHSAQAPCLWIGRGEADIDMFRGNFSVKDCLSEKLALTDTVITPQGRGWDIHFSRGDVAQTTLHITGDAAGRLEMTLSNSDKENNRMWLRLAAQQEDHIYGCGEQFSYFNLRGKPFPCGPASRGLAVTNKAMLPGRPIAKKTPVAIITGHSSHNRHLLVAKNITATLITVVT